MPTPVDRLYTEAKEAIKVLQDQRAVSLELALSDNLRKSLLLAAASYFESRISNDVIEFVGEQSHGSLIQSFVRNKAVARQYHTWFTWSAKNCNTFFALFGDPFRQSMQAKIAKAAELEAAIVAFLELGNERNKLVHQDYASFPMDKTIDEVYELYQRAMTFVEAIPTELRACEPKGGKLNSPTT